MTHPNLIHVAPVGPGWRVSIPGDSVDELVQSRTEAIARALELARGAHTGARVVVLGRDGHVEQELDPAHGVRRT